MESSILEPEASGLEPIIEHMRSELGRLGPLRITAAAIVAGETLSLAGDAWALSSPSAWRVVSNGMLDFGWSDTTAEAGLAGLVGLDVVGVEQQSTRVKGDPAFHLSDERWIEIFSDQPVDPWALLLPSIVFVGAPSDLS